MSLPVTTGLLLDLDAQAITGVSDASALTTWNDTSGAGRSVTQSTADEKPTYRTNGIGGHASVDFDGTGDSMQGAVPVGDDYTIVAVVQPDTTTGTGDQNTYGFTICAPTTGYAAWVALRNGEVRHWAYEASSTGQGETTGASIVDGEPVIITITATRNTASGAKVYVDGTLRLTQDADNAGFAGDFCVGDLRDARLINFDGLIGEILVYSRVLTTEEQSSVESYLNTKWIAAQVVAGPFPTHRRI